jgi:isopenicillin N synthase-like dioxygenase
MGARPHQDTSFFTILLQDDVGGLEVQARNGEWLAAPPRPDMFVVNAGEFLERLTCGCFCSAMHRVVNRSRSERYSVPFFVSPSYPTVMSPLTEFATRPGAQHVEPTHIGNAMTELFRSLWPTIGAQPSGRR